MTSKEMIGFSKTIDCELTGDPDDLVSLADYDAAAYRPYLDGLDVSEAQKDEFLRVMWRMMRLFVELNVPAENWGQIVDVFTKASTSDSVEVK